MIDRRPVLGVRVAAVDRPEAANLIAEAARDKQPFGVTALAVHGVMESVQDPDLRYRLNDLEMVVADGQPVRWALKWLHGVSLPDRVCGPDLMEDLLRIAAAEGLPIYLYGSTQETLDNLTRHLDADYPGIVIAGTQPSRFRHSTAEEQADDIERIRASGAQLVFAGLGCPRQEIWTYEMRRGLSLPVLAIGAAFDYHARQLKRAPMWMQKRGLEWLYRLMQEPRRLWKRYLLLNPAYLTLVGLQRLKLRTIDPDKVTQEPTPVRPG